MADLQAIAPKSTRKSTTPELRKLYAKRMAFLKAKWDELMQVQDSMTIEQIKSKEHQANRQRIGRLYNQMKDVIMKPRREAINNTLKNIAIHFNLR